MGTRHNETGFIGNYDNGKAVGPVWIGMLGGGFLHGDIPESNDGMFTGDDLAYIYPDMETVLKGKFVDRVMISARESAILEDECDQGIRVVSKYAKPDPDGPAFYFDPPSNVSFGAGPPNVVDPFERKWCKVAPSSIGAGEGVYMLRDAPAERTVNLYSGFLYDYPEEVEIFNRWCKQNTSMSDEERRECNKYGLGTTPFEALIEIPPDMDQPGVFHPTMGPKVNHHFRSNNSYYYDFESPRWGVIRSVRTAKTVKAGDELFTFYYYSKEWEFPDDFPWYWEAKTIIDRNERLEDEAKKKKKAEKKRRKKSDNASNK